MKAAVVIVVIGMVLLAACSPAAPVQAPRPTENTAAAAVTRAAATQVLDVGGGAGGASAPLASPQANATGAPASDEAVIVLKRGGGFAGVDEEWTIYASGRVAPAEGAERTVAAEAVDSLLADIEARGFFELADAYGRGSKCNDCFQLELTVTHNGRTKTVTAVDAAPDTPPALQEIVSAVLALAGG